MYSSKITCIYIYMATKAVYIWVEVLVNFISVYPIDWFKSLYSNMNTDEPMPETVNYYNIDDNIIVKVCIYEPEKITFVLQHCTEGTSKRLL